MKIAVVGSEGYIGRALCSRLEKNGQHNVLRLDALVYGQRQPSGMRYVNGPKTATKILLDFRPEVVVWLAAYAHDPKGFITKEEMFRNNAYFPLSVFHGVDLCHSSCRWIFTSSLSTMSTFGAYPYSKRALESMLVELPHNRSFWTNVDLVRFGTIYGVDNEYSDVESFRSHLLLNSMVASTIFEDKIRISQPDTFRPVFGLDQALEVLVDRIREDQPRGSITNHFDTCASLHQFAIWVQGVAKEYDFNPELNYGFVRVDPRDYGWGRPDDTTVKPRLHKLFQWMLTNRAHVRANKGCFPENLYGYVQRLRATENPPVGD